MHQRFLAILLLAAIGTVLAVVAYAAPLGNTGVDGTIGALLALIGAIVTAAGTALLASGSVPRRFASLLIGLLVLAAVLTAVAGYFLMQFGLAIVMALTALALLLAPFLPSRWSSA
ncbi:MAG: hypothetical protein KUA43_05170 [Hoeflea sp.]|uniref:hypothetical protein n=1 Tax=Hoeflea sp. TaxID=1940281 RepID=UPI001DAEEAB5|nr:hypothetical protein [Hoeflea sp.]MBU4530922.1 hypothetical protein [Alphaproteobacteria bacterium]MBU4542697.1 hypothetical protein [Alphaproteobacteria bacterium]MBU4549376.1 hypothetical protein [Alphaproteobacteria bacterium]MBV1722814.1 hypothetical protein [Hoeflea sp.]MBV1761536.1 hypothetical protein [Hoeflea sp.]